MFWEDLAKLRQTAQSPQPVSNENKEKLAEAQARWAITTLHTILSQLDPEFSRAPIEKRQKAVMMLASNPELLDRVFSELDPEWAKAPAEKKQEALSYIYQGEPSVREPAVSPVDVATFWGIGKLPELAAEGLGKAILKAPLSFLREYGEWTLFTGAEEKARELVQKKTGSKLAGAVAGLLAGAGAVSGLDYALGKLIRNRADEAALKKLKQTIEQKPEELEKTIGRIKASTAVSDDFKKVLDTDLEHLLELHRQKVKPEEIVIIGEKEQPRDIKLVDEDKERFLELLKKPKALWTAEDKVFYDAYMRKGQKLHVPSTETKQTEASLEVVEEPPKVEQQRTELKKIILSGKQQENDIEKLLEAYRRASTPQEREPYYTALKQKYAEILRKELGDEVPQEVIDREAGLLVLDAARLGHETVLKNLEGTKKRIVKELEEAAAGKEPAVAKKDTIAELQGEKSEGLERPNKPFRLVIEPGGTSRVELIEKAYPYKINGHPVWLHKIGNEWRVTEANTGLLITTGDTKQEALGEAAKLLQQRGQVEIKKAIERALKEYYKPGTKPIDPATFKGHDFTIITKNEAGKFIRPDFPFVKEHKHLLPLVGKVESYNVEGFPVWVHGKRTRKWFVYEMNTGMPITRGATKEEALENAQRLLSDKEYWEEQIAKELQDFEPPRKVVNAEQLPKWTPQEEKEIIIKPNQEGRYKRPDVPFFLTDDGIIPIKGKAHRVEIEGFPFWVHKDDVGYWRVTEANTGMLVARAPTKKEAIAKAEELVKKHDREKMLEAIEKALKEKYEPGTGIIVNYKHLNEGDTVRAVYKGKVYEGTIIGPVKRKGNFVFRMIRTPEGKEQAMPWTPKAKYELLRAGISPQDIVQALKESLEQARSKLADIAAEHNLWRVAEALGYAKDITERHPRIRLPMTMFPETFFRRFPVVKDIWKAQVERERLANRWADYVERRVFRLIDRLNKDERSKLFNLLYRESYTGKPAAELLEQLSPTAKRAYRAIRKVLRDVWQDLIEEKKTALRSWVEHLNISEADKQKALEAIETADPEKLPQSILRKSPAIVAHLRELADMRAVPYYMPQHRLGAWLLRVRTPDGKFHFTIDFDTAAEAKAAKDLIESGDDRLIKAWFEQIGIEPAEYDVRDLKAEVFPRRNLPAEVIDTDIASAKLKGLLASLAERRQGSESELWEALADDLSTFLKQRGWSSHLIRRKNIPGFQLTPEKAEQRLRSYLYGYGLAKAKRRAAETSWRVFYDAVLNNKLPGEAVKYLKNYLDYVFSSPEHPWALKASRFLTTYYLWGNLVSPIINATQNLVTGIPAYIHHGIPASYLAKALKDIALEKLSREERKAIAQLIRDGDLEAQAMREALSRWRFTKSVLDKGMLPFRFVEVWINRAPHFLGAFRYFRKVKKQPYEEALEKAREVMFEGHYYATRVSRAPLQRGEWGRLLSALQTFTYHYLKQMGMYMREKDWRAFWWGVLAPIILGGASALPAKDVLRKVYEHITGRPPELEAKRQGEAGKLMRYGLLFYISPSLSRRVGVGLEAEEPWRNYGGALLSFVRRLESAQKLADRGDWYGAVATIAPGFIRNLMLAVRQYKEGVVTQKRQPVAPKLKPTLLEALIMAVGLTPPRIQEAWDTRRLAHIIQETRNRHLARFVNAYLSADTAAERRKVLEALRQYNKQIAGEAKNTNDKRLRAYYKALLISGDTFRQALRGKRKPYVGVSKPALSAAF